MSDANVQTRNLPLLATREHCSGKTYVVTGANTGLGFEAAKHLVALGSAKVILAVRNLNAGNSAKAKIEADTGITGVVDVWHLDLADYDSIKSFASKVRELKAVEGVVMNASVADGSGKIVNGLDVNVAVNVMGTFLLTLLIMGKLRETKGRVVVVSSRAGFEVKELWGKIKGDPLRFEGIELGAYPISKLIETFAARQLAELLPVSKTGVVINIVCPGICITDLDRSSPPELRNSLAELRAKVGRTAEDGSRTLLHGLVAGEETHGLLLHSCEVGEADVPDWVTDNEGRKDQQKVWDAVAAELENIEPGCVKSVLN